jgi:hypothetical protein
MNSTPDKIKLFSNTFPAPEHEFRRGSKEWGWSKK